MNKETHNGLDGGMLKGKSHAQGGIKAVVVTDENRPVELEGDEVIINKNTVQMSKKFEFEGEEKTPKQILSELNEAGGGIPIFEKGGQIDDWFGAGGVVHNEDRSITIKYERLSDGRYEVDLPKGTKNMSSWKFYKYLKKHDFMRTGGAVEPCWNCGETKDKYYIAWAKYASILAKLHPHKLFRKEDIRKGDYIFQYCINIANWCLFKIIAIYKDHIVAINVATQTENEIPMQRLLRSDVTLFATEIIMKRGGRFQQNLFEEGGNIESAADFIRNKNEKHNIYNRFSHAGNDGIYKGYTWDELPEKLKVYKKIPELRITHLVPEDKELQKLMFPLTVKDDMRPVFANIYFSDNAIIATTAHVLGALPSRVDDRYKNKMFNEKGFEFKDGKYPNFMGIFPEESKFVHEVDFVTLITFAKAARPFVNESARAVSFTFGDNQIIGFRHDLIINLCEWFLRQGIQKGYGYFENPSRMGLFSTKKSESVKSLIGKEPVMLVMPILMDNDYEDGGIISNTLCQVEMDYGYQLWAHFAFEKNAIMSNNHQITINPQFDKPPTDQDGILVEWIREIGKLNKSTGKSIAIGEESMVKDNVLKAFGFEYSVMIINCGLKDGFYKVFKGDVLLEVPDSSSSFEDYPIVEENKNQNIRIYDAHNYEHPDKGKRPYNNKELISVFQELMETLFEPYSNQTFEENEKVIVFDKKFKRYEGEVTSLYGDNTQYLVTYKTDNGHTLREKFEPKYIRKTISQNTVSKPEIDLIDAIDQEWSQNFQQFLGRPLKPPYEMTKKEWTETLEKANEFEKKYGKFKELAYMSYGIADVHRTDGTVKCATHYDVISKAIERGKKIPVDVLNEYPTLHSKNNNPIKKEPETLSEMYQKAKELGVDAFKKGMKCVPAMDKDLMDLIAKTNDDHEANMRILESWIKAWTKENIDNNPVEPLNEKADTGSESVSESSNEFGITSDEYKVLDITKRYKSFYRTDYYKENNISKDKLEEIKQSLNKKGLASWNGGINDQGRALIKKIENSDFARTKEYINDWVYKKRK